MTTPGGWGAQPGPYGPPPQQPLSPYGQPLSPYAQQPSPYAQQPPEAPSGPGGKGRSRFWLGFGAVVLVVVVVAVLAVVFGGRGNRPDGPGQSAQQGVAADAKDKRKTGGPFLDPIPARPVSLWTDQARDIVGGSTTSVWFMAGNENTALVSGFNGTDYSLIALDTATGKKKWQAPRPFGASLTSCDLAEDGGALCWTEFATDSPLDVAPSDTLRLAFFGPDGTAGKAISLPKERYTRVFPARDGFLIEQWRGTADDAVLFVTSFTNLGEQRWRVEGKLGQSDFDYSVPSGLFVLSDSFSARVYNLDTGQPIGDYPSLGDGAAPKSTKVALTAAGFSVSTEKRVEVYDPQGKKVNQIAGWNTPGTPLRPSSNRCGQVMLANQDGGIAAADAATGQILWQTHVDGDPSSASFACVGGYMLLRGQGSNAVDIYESDTGKKTGSIAAIPASWSVVGTDGSVLLAWEVSDRFKSYTAYDLATGKQVWASPRSENGQYLFCALNGTLNPGRHLMGGGLYYTVQGIGGSITRLGQKP